MSDNENDVLDIHYEIQKYLNSLLKNKQKIEFEIFKNINRWSTDNLPYGSDNSLLSKYKDKYKLLLENKELNEMYITTKSKIKKDTNESKHYNYKDWKDSITKIEECEKKIDCMENIIPFFLSNVESIVNDYTEEIKTPVSSTFMGYKLSNKNPQLETLYNNYLDKGKDIFGEEEFYKIIKKQPKIETPSISQVCASTQMYNCIQNDTSDDLDDNYKVQFDDIGRVNLNQKYKYERKIHFRDTLQQFQGIQNKQINDKVFKDLEECLKLHSLIDEKYTDKRKYNRVTKNHIRTFLNETGNSIHYEDTQLIYTKLTGKSSPNISKYEADLFKDFDDLVNAYLQLPEEVRKNRKNFLNNQYVLGQLLKRRNIKIPDADLTYLKTPSRLREHDEIYSLCCEILGWDFKPLS
jgi:hypothetical protein